MPGVPVDTRSPRAFAVFRLMTTSNFVGCSMGSLLGFAELVEKPLDPIALCGVLRRPAQLET